MNLWFFYNFNWRNYPWFLKNYCDPTSKYKQDGCEGIQYCCDIYFEDKLSKEVINKVINIRKKYNEFYVEIEQLKHFIKAENYHQDYQIRI
ncbi:peptide-methionine (S)-S-oxide reductase [Mycoplasma phocoenae]|uniref:peptide-methionine (S)-S-oxide reductase n=1 Tax=Mycoplasma phocoenae TaxID=754517 RepID=UPI003AF6773C